MKSVLYLMISCLILLFRKRLTLSYSRHLDTDRWLDERKYVMRGPFIFLSLQEFVSLLSWRFMYNTACIHQGHGQGKEHEVWPLGTLRHFLWCVAFMYLLSCSLHKSVTVASWTS
jgi:hypothetical protein